MGRSGGGKEKDIANTADLIINKYCVCEYRNKKRREEIADESSSPPM